MDPEVRRLRDEVALLREEIHQLKAAMAPPRRLRFEGLALPPSEDALLRALFTTECDLSWERCQHVVAIALKKTDGTDQSVAVCLSRLRRKLWALDPPVEIVTVRYFGLSMPPKSRQRLQARLIPPKERLQ